MEAKIAFNILSHNNYSKLICSYHGPGNKIRIFKPFIKKQVLIKKSRTSLKVIINIKHYAKKKE